MCKDPLNTMDALEASVNVGLSYSCSSDSDHSDIDDSASLRTVCVPSENKNSTTSNNNNNTSVALTTRQEMYLLLMADRSQVCDGRSVEMLWRDCITNTNDRGEGTTTADVDVDRSSHVKRKDDKVKRSGIRHRLSWHGINSSKKNDVDDAQLSVSCHNSHRLSWYVGSSSKTSDIDARLSSSCHNHSHDTTPSSQVEFQGQQYKNKSHPNSSSSIGNGLWNSYIPVRGKKKKDTMLSNQPSYIIPDPQIKTSRRPSSSSSHRPSEGSLVSVDGSISQSSLFEESSVTSDDPASPKEDLDNDDNNLTGASFDTVEMSPDSSNDKKNTSDAKDKKSPKKKKKTKNKNKKKNKQQAVVLPRRSSDQSLYTSDPNLLASASRDREQEESTMINDYLSSEADAALSRSTHTHNSHGNVTRRRKFQPRHRCQSINDSVTGIVKPPRYTTITSSSSTTNSSSSQANTTSSTIATSTHSTDNNNTNSRSPTPRLRRANRRNSAPNFALVPRQLSGSFTQLKPDEIEKLKDTLLSIGSSSADDSNDDVDDEAEDNNDHDENNSCTGAEIEKGGFKFRRSASTSSNGNTVDYVDISTHSNASWIPTGVDFSANMEVYVFQKNEDV